MTMNTKISDMVTSAPNENTEMYDRVNLSTNIKDTTPSNEPTVMCDAITSPSSQSYQNPEIKPNQINYEEVEGYEEPVMVYLTCLNASRKA